MFRHVTLVNIFKKNDRKCNKITRKVFSLPMFVTEMCAGWKKTDLVGLVY